MSSYVALVTPRELYHTSEKHFRDLSSYRYCCLPAGSVRAVLVKIVGEDFSVLVVALFE